MGRDKALLPFRGMPLALHVASSMTGVVETVKLVGDPSLYANLGLPVIPDVHPGCGPLGGVEAALNDTATDWNLLIACDMPDAAPDFLRTLIDAAATANTRILMPVGPGGRPEPLCAVWHRDAREAVATALDGGIRKMTDILPLVPHVLFPVADELHFKNLNTPEDWTAHAAR
jgi:molybdopterin-guanine dinucleotide biosynthesis protein A